MNSVTVIEKPPRPRVQPDEHRRLSGVATGRVNLVERHRSDAGWHAAVITAVLKLGLEAALTDAARTEVELYLEREHLRGEF